ncbi:MAG: hypothetical protein DSM107014_14275 [Gomphosphaeria aponina SAG 52.96 = DSM 107014]|uniref:Uncharacterized protein n=1 Tax=Gomphosphaeria aponina SAG 52.96 = DSM 107014 TaxID=1521640 RepID=A0A941GXI7_9CHRO|nr:hypothetical protein [Gomphosphaeria aponina SAG 52.96 = DSM 107014]
MNNSYLNQKHCSFCGQFQLEGHRGGHCEQLNVLVKGSWNACPFFVPRFTSLIEELNKQKHKHSLIKHRLKALINRSYSKPLFLINSLNDCLERVEVSKIQESQNLQLVGKN